MITRFVAALALLLLAPSIAYGQAEPSPFTSGTRYDASGRVTGVISPDPDGPSGPLPFRAVRNSYDGAGRLVTVETGTLAAWQSEAVAPASWPSFTVHHTLHTTYDGSNRKLSDALSGGGMTHGLTQYSYDAAGRLECTSVRMDPAAFASPPSSACDLGAAGSLGPDRITHNTYDAAGQLLQVQEAYGTAEQTNVVTRTYTLNGKVETLTDGENNRTTYVYDGLDRLSRTRFPSLTQGSGTSSTTDYEELSYDANGNVTSRRLRDGTSIALAYDALNRLTTRDLPGSEPTVTYGYDLLGRMITAVDANGLSSGWSFDALGHVTSESHGTLGVNVMQYDAAGRLARLTWPDTFYVTYEHLITGEVSAIREYGSTTTTCDGQPSCVLATFGYDGLGRRISITRGNGTSTSYGYDAVSRLTDLSHDLTSAGTDLALTFTRNPASQLVTRAGAYAVYAYTDRANANVADSVNGLNQVTLTGATSLTHDARGNITGIGSSAYTYTAENRLISAPASVTLTYWPTGALAAANSPYYGLTRFDHVGQALIAEYDGSGALLRRYVHGPGMDEPLVSYLGAGTTGRNFLHADERGSITVLTDAAGSGAGYNAYDEYGRPQGAWGVPLWGRFGYTGQAWLPELGMHYYRARIYNPTLGRFMQTDPVGYDDGPNLYEYAGSDPVNATDPDGTQSTWETIRSEVADLAWRIPHDIAALARHLWRNDQPLEWYVGGLPPTLSGGAGAARNIPTLMTGTRIARQLPNSRVTATVPYRRPSGATTDAQRASVQGRPCVHCGQTSGRQVAGHRRPLVREHYETGTIDVVRARRLDAVRPECPTCSAREGAEMSRYSRRMRARLDDPH